MTEQLYIRWMIRRDMPEVLAIEAESFEFPWTGKDFARCLRRQSVIGIVAEHNDRTVGYMIYALSKHRIDVLNFAVAPEHRERGIGSQMLAKLKRKLSPNRRNRLLFKVRETNVAGQLWLRSHGFRWVATLESQYKETDEDCYVMQHRFSDKQRWLPRNRIARDLQDARQEAGGEQGTDHGSH